VVIEEVVGSRRDAVRDVGRKQLAGARRDGPEKRRSSKLLLASVEERTMAAPREEDN
jgi:hypothetical protein